MPLPKRIYLENHPYFVVFNTCRRAPLFTSKICCEILIENLKFYREKYHFKLFGFSIIPCHFLGIFSPRRPEEISKIISGIKNYSRNQILEMIKKDKIIDYHYPCGQKCSCKLYPVPRLNGKVSVAQNTDACMRIGQLGQGPVVTRYESRNIGVPSPMGSKDIQLWPPDAELKELLKLKTIWQGRFWDHLIRNDQDFEEKLNYINHNPIKHGLVFDPVDYKYSSAGNYYLNDHSLIQIDLI